MIFMGPKPEPPKLRSIILMRLKTLELYLGFYDDV